jgi:ISXO2-like transposase domain
VLRRAAPAALVLVFVVSVGVFFRNEATGTNANAGATCHPETTIKRRGSHSYAGYIAIFDGPSTIEPPIPASDSAVLSIGQCQGGRHFGQNDCPPALQFHRDLNGAKGHSALQLSRDLDCQYKTAFVLAHKIREAIGAEQSGATVGGDGKSVEIDGAYFGGYVKPANYKEHRRDLRLAANRTGKRRVVVVMRERGGRTLPFVFKAEDESLPTIRERLPLGTTVYADDANHWRGLNARYLTRQVDHSVCYSDGEACSNQAESFFSRLRRAEIGIHHKIAGPYLGSYANEMTWREDFRRASNGELFLMAARAAGCHPVSEKWCGYWQRSMQ